MDDLTDNRGRAISFKNTVVICTSNLGTKLIQDELLKGTKSVKRLRQSPRGQAKETKEDDRER